MKRFKKGFITETLVSLTILIGVIVVFYLLSMQKCLEPVKYSVGVIDPRFKVNKAQIEYTAMQAGKVWNSQTGKNLLVYDPDAELKINFVYDERQAEIDRIKMLSDAVVSKSTTVTSLTKEFNTLLKSYNEDLSKYNASVSEWNSKGGAPSDVYAALEKKRLDLDERKKILLSLSKTLNIKINDYNNNAQNLNTEIDSQRNIIITQGLYKPAESEIEVYTYDGDTDELELVLVHELGHSLKLDHASRPDSVMYYLLESQNMKNITLTDEDKSMVNSRCDVRKVGLYTSFIPKKLFRNTN